MALTLVPALMLNALVQTDSCRMYSTLYKAPSPIFLLPLALGAPLPDFVAVKSARVRPKESSISYARSSIEAFLQGHERLRHPNVLPFLGYIILDDIQPSLLSPFCGNGNIVAFLDRHPEADRVKFLVDAFQAVCYLHEHEVAHKNIIPGNILINDRGEACLSDLGVSDLLRGVSPVPEGRIPDSWIYKPSEELAGADSPFSLSMWFKIDVYSLTSTVYEVLSGERPVPPSRNQCLSQRPIPIILTIITSGHVDIPRPQSISRPVWQAIRLGWRRDPELRPSIVDFAEAFSQSLSL